MGVGQSKDEQLYQAVSENNILLVKSLRRDGASLEWIDKDGRTSLILACVRGELYDMAVNLLNLGANINAYRPGPNGGYPLHHAAKRGLEKTVQLLLLRGANPLAINDDNVTPLEVARNKGHISVVRIIENQICLFSGMFRELSGPGLLEAFAPQWVTKKVWAVVLPAKSGPNNPPKHELVIYVSPKIATVRSTIPLWKADIEAPNYNAFDPILVITDKTTKAKTKLLSELEGDKSQLEKMHLACIGIPQVARSVLYPLPPNGMPVHLPAAHVPSQPAGNIVGGPSDLPEELAIAMAIDASLQSASAEGIPTPTSSGTNNYGGWDTVPQQSSDDWKPSESNPEKSPAKLEKTSDYGGWVDPRPESYNGWLSESGPSASTSLGPQTEDSSEAHLNTVQSNAHVSAPETLPSPSAPPFSEVSDGPIYYPSVDTSPITIDYPSAQLSQRYSTPAVSSEEKTTGLCVICWDAPAQGACVPCGHLAGCMGCLAEVKEKHGGCPVCRATIEQVVKVYTV